VETSFGKPFQIHDLEIGLDIKKDDYFLMTISGDNFYHSLEGEISR
jgi:hypothetical protein